MGTPTDNWTSVSLSSETVVVQQQEESVHLRFEHREYDYSYTLVNPSFKSRQGVAEVKPCWFETKVAPAVTKGLLHSFGFHNSPFIICSLLETNGHRTSECTSNPSMLRSTSHSGWFGRPSITRLYEWKCRTGSLRSLSNIHFHSLSIGFSSQTLPLFCVSSFNNLRFYKGRTQRGFNAWSLRFKNGTVLLQFL